MAIFWSGAIQWCNELKEKGIKFYIVSNSNKKEKIERVSKAFDVKYLLFALKPFKKGLKKAMNLLDSKANNIAVVGDQIFTDVWGANRCNMFSILVKPIDEKDIWLTVIKRPFENYVLKKFKNKEKK